jgi:hypothetical protein
VRCRVVNLTGSLDSVVFAWKRFLVAGEGRGSLLVWGRSDLAASSAPHLPRQSTSVTCRQGASLLEGFTPAASLHSIPVAVCSSELHSHTSLLNCSGLSVVCG